MTKRAVVLEIRERTCTVVTADGEFREVKKRGNYRPGQEITIPTAVFGAGKYSLIAACLLFFLMAATFWSRWMTPAVAAYVSLDINPSVEMALDRENVVIDIQPLNDDGKDLIAGLTLKGLSVEIAIEKIVEAAVSKEFIIPGEENVVLSAVTPLGGDPVRTESLVTESIRVSINKHSIKAQIVVKEATPYNRDRASKAGISAGRYMLYLDASNNNSDVRPEDFKDKGKFKNEINKRYKAESISGKEPEDRGKDNGEDESGGNGNRKRGKEGGPGGGKGPAGARSPGYDDDDSPGSTGRPDVVIMPGQSGGHADEENKATGREQVEKEKNKNKEKNRDKNNGRGSNDSEERPDREGIKGTAGDHGSDYPRQKDRGRD
ncbi:MAG: anti-sigma factor domain-containing protein [Bacillota bacterium]